MGRGVEERCRYCGRALEAHLPEHRRNWPFCCRRCRLAELGRWFDERYVISRRTDDVADDAGPEPRPPGGDGGASPAEGIADNNT